jgi:SAM-dependent methyltransferase
MSEKFDRYGQSYRTEIERAISFIGTGLDVFTEAKAVALLTLIHERLGDPGEVRALDVGCGPGETDLLLTPMLAELHGVDVSAGVLEVARSRNRRATYRVYGGDRLPYGDDQFDLAFAINVIHHLQPERWEAFARELARVVRPGGLAAIIEHNPRNPLTRLAVARCAFDDDAVLLDRRGAERLLELAGLTRIEARYIVFSIFRGRAFRLLERKLQRIPLGAQYLCAGEAT